jgi:hypothetical protein
MVLMRLLKPLFGRASVGGNAVSLLAREPAEAVHGRYFDRTRPVKPKPRGRDDALARGLWDYSLRAVGLLEDGIRPGGDLGIGEDRVNRGRKDGAR